MAPPVSGLRGTYNTNLRSRDEWGRIGPMITALGTMTETFPRTSGRDFSFELTCHFPPVQTFDASRLVRTVNVNALLLSPAHFQVKHRRDTGTTIQQFAESNKRSASVILYLMDSSSSGAQQIEATQALGALHHCLSLGIADPPPVLVISDASYLLDCVEGFMRSLSRVIHLDSKASAFGQKLDTPVKRETPFGNPNLPPSMKVSPFAQSLFGKPSLPPSPFDLANRQPSFGSIASSTTELTVPGSFGTHSSLFGPGAGFKVAETLGAPKSLFGPGAGISPSSGLTAPVTETPGAPKSLFGTGTSPAPEGNKPSLFGPGPGTGTTDSSSSLFGRSSSVAPQSTDVAKSHSLFGPPPNADPKENPFGQPHK